MERPGRGGEAAAAGGPGAGPDRRGGEEARAAPPPPPPPVRPSGGAEAFCGGRGGLSARGVSRGSICVEREFCVTLENLSRETSLCLSRHTETRRASLSLGFGSREAPPVLAVPYAEVVQAESLGNSLFISPPVQENLGWASERQLAAAALQLVCLCCWSLPLLYFPQSSWVRK